ncbi:hypothetical protein GCM10010339_26420 [Streptomyces alanosinicus]|uniref:Uncharacterized protein n=1 Tax=Streptomyces alanosinicus TaxID=68171 RepID=A0A918YFT4_9ACTN|nr:hypothetical protein GCM10010339_26420 [Streptomyces alanosinicus]
MQPARESGQSWAGFTRIDARAVGGTTPGSVLTIHLSRHDPELGANTDAQLLSSFLTAVDAGPHGDVASRAAFTRGSKTSLPLPPGCGRTTPQNWSWTGSCRNLLW